MNFDKDFWLFFFHVMVTIAEMECELIVERTHAGLDVAHKDGRKPKMTDSKIESAKELLASGVPLKEEYFHMPHERNSKNKIIWTIGHSTRSLKEFIGMLKSFQIEVVTDIRSFPGSRRVPHFNKEALEISLPQAGLQYIHIKDLGGRRKVHPDSKNTSWRHPAFRGYADFMETETFLEGIITLEQIALKQRTAYMCSEAVWWRCHRSMVSDCLKAEGWKVMHIMGVEKADEHHFTQPAKIIDGRLSYEPEQ